VEAVLVVAPEQAVAAPLVDVQPAAPGDHDVDAVLPRVPEPLEVSLPVREAVDLVEGREGLRRPGLRFRTMGVEEAVGVAGDRAPPRQIVPVAVEIGRASLLQQMVDVASAAGATPVRAPRRRRSAVSPEGPCPLACCSGCPSRPAPPFRRPSAPL
jgi:hypothetical protein